MRMRKFAAAALTVLLLGGCAPKLGKDIFVEPEGNVRWENSGSEVVLGVLSLLGAPLQSAPIRIGSDLKVNNQWHSDFKVVSLTYALVDDKERFAQGQAKIDTLGSMLIPSGESKIIPLELEVDPRGLKSDRIIGIVKAKRKVMLKGELIIEVWGIRKHYPFEKEATALIQKALKSAMR